MDTIAAIATPLAPSAIGILRLSGEHAISIVSALFHPFAGGSLSDAPNRKLIYGTFYDETGCVLDHCLATISRSPHSYTGEDTAELQCHGSPLLLARGLEALFAMGARQARPGEFTKRAFLNGQMDLTQAEAVIDLIDAQTEAASRNASAQLAGAVRLKIGGIYDNLLNLTAQFHALLDYPEEDIEEIDESQIEDTLQNAIDSLGALSRSFQQGRLFTQGIPTAIVGRPNVGKSSLLNALLGYERAIVSSVPGTTRDTVEERVSLDGLLLRLIDTAGLRETADPIEQMGTERTRHALAEAELILAVFDASEPILPEDNRVLDAIQNHKNVILIRNKSDLPALWEERDLPAGFAHICTISTQQLEGLDTLIHQIHQLFPKDSTIPAGEILTNARQAGAAARALEALETAQRDLQTGMTPDAILTGVEDALSHLGEITGATLQEALVSRIFERFCVGK
ncbi:MAG: tRNA uridine-5-carboxymethylaminomethyl(34) synthesis GTPase MnmE [Oscillospiraceae bacterium]|nr:tRNA uridine-5-carboxymethylaminomethyl(34) synthesis GTPase MnmE [Oscillospiraceae bacterium]